PDWLAPSVAPGLGALPETVACAATPGPRAARVPRAPRARKVTAAPPASAVRKARRALRGPAVHGAASGHRAALGPRHPGWRWAAGPPGRWRSSGQPRIPRHRRCDRRHGPEAAKDPKAPPARPAPPGP